MRSTTTQSSKILIATKKPFAVNKLIAVNKPFAVNKPIAVNKPFAVNKPIADYKKLIATYNSDPYHSENEYRYIPGHGWVTLSEFMKMKD